MHRYGDPDWEGNETIKGLIVVLVIMSFAPVGWSQEAAPRTNEHCEIGGPLAGVKLPLFPTRHGEQPGDPGCIPELQRAEKEKDPNSTLFIPQGNAPEWRALYPGSVEHFRAYWFKYCPIRSSFDRQSQLKNFVAPDIPGAGKEQIEQYAAPVYRVGRFAHRNTGRFLKPVPVVRCKAGAPILKLDLGTLGQGLYALRVIGAFNRDLRCRGRDTNYEWPSVHGHLRIVSAYDQLFDYIQGNEELAQSVGRFVPWVKTSQDMIQLLNVCLVQNAARRILRYQYHKASDPGYLLPCATVLAAPEVTEPWMEWLFSKAFLYPNSPTGIQDLLISQTDRDGIMYVGSYAYSRPCVTDLADLHRHVELTGSQRFNLRDRARCPKPYSAYHFNHVARTAGLCFPRMGDVSGPDKSYGHWFQDKITRYAGQAWRWTRDPVFVYILKHHVGRGTYTDEEWAEIGAASRSASEPCG